MNTYVEHTGSRSLANMIDGQPDLNYVKRQIRISRLKLGSILDVFDRKDSSQIDVDLLLESTCDIAAGIDRLVEVLSANLSRDDSEV